MQPSSEMHAMVSKSSWRASPPVLAREDCTTCQGTGWQLLPGTVSALARRCACRAEVATSRLTERVRIPKRYQLCTFESFTPLNFSHVRAHTEANRFAERFPNVERGLFFVGSAGVGKTHLGVAILRELLQRFQEDILFTDFQTMLASARRIEWGCLRKVSLLLIDNFGLASPSRENVCATEELLRSRLDAGSPTILTGERVRVRHLFDRKRDILPSQTQQFMGFLSGGLLLRLLGNCRILTMVGEDYRIAHGLSKPLLFP